MDGWMESDWTNLLSIIFCFLLAAEPGNDSKMFPAGTSSSTWRILSPHCNLQCPALTKLLAKPVGRKEKTSFSSRKSLSSVLFVLPLKWHPVLTELLLIHKIAILSSLCCFKGSLLQSLLTCHNLNSLLAPTFSTQKTITGDVTSDGSISRWMCRASDLKSQWCSSMARL